ncbi:MAG: ACP S-malonyltransferase [Planctomycetes bacterium]|nr:ACP S-malonyltransferase [Planctomycetota bacterium]
MTQNAWICPGQGAQHPGMGKDFYERHAVARAIFDRADAVLGIPLTQWIFEGDAERVNATDVAQPGIFVTSVAILSVIEEQLGKKPSEGDATAGLSLGEYTALWAAGSLSFEDAVKLVRARGTYMQAASEAQPSGMSSVIGLEVDAIREACAEAASAGIVGVANLNAPGQIVISGTHAGLERASEILKAKGARRVIPLKVAGAFHSEVMRPAADRLRADLAKVSIQPPRTRFLPNTTGEWMSSPEQIRSALAEQVCAPVLWEKSMRAALGAGYTNFLEPGPGSVLQGLLRKIEPSAVVKSFPDLGSLAAS